MPNLDEATTTDLMASWGALLGGSATVIAAAAAVGAAVVGVNTLRASKQDSRNRSRPMVGALLERDPHPTSRTASLVVRNYGRAVAYSVEVTFDPPLVDALTRSEKPSLVPFILDRYRSPIHNLMPGIELSNIWYLGADGGNNKTVNDLPIPDRVTVKIRYSDKPNFWDRDGNRYVDEFVIDTDVLRAETFSSHSHGRLNLQKKSTKALEDLVPAIKQMSKDIREIQDHLMPETTRSRKAAEKAREEEQIREMEAQLFPNRHKPSTDEE